MALKKVEIILTKRYLLAWFFGLGGLFLFWLRWYVPAVFMFLICYAYSVADYSNPSKRMEDDVNSDDDDIKPA